MIALPSFRPCFTTYGEFSPLQLSPILWLDPSQLSLSNGASVTSLPDLSGNGRNATPIATAPTFETSGPNSQQWIVANNAGLVTPAFSQFPAKRGTWFFVYRPSDQNASWRRVFGTNSGGTGVTYAWGNDTTSNTQFYHGSSFSTGATRLMWDRSNDVVIMCLRQDSDTTVSVFRGASKCYPMAIADNLAASNPLRIGQSLVGRIGECFGYDSALTDLQCFVALDYLSKKWAASARRSVNIVFEGDSQTYGSGLGSNTHTRIVEDSTWPHKLITELGNPQHVSYHNLAIGGSQWAQLGSRASACDQRINPRAINILFAWCGTNEAYLADAAATYAAQVAYCNARKAAGWDKIIVGTAMDRIDQSNEPWRSALNTLIRTGYSEHADGLIDIGGHPILGAAGAYNDATYFNSTDKVHLNATGWQIVAEIAAEVALPYVAE